MKKRVISAVIALAIFIPLIALGGMWFRLAVSVLAVIGMNDFLDLEGKDKRPKYVNGIFYALVLLLTYFDIKRESYYLLTLLLPMLAVIYCNNNKKYNADDAFRLIGMAVLIGTVFNKVVAIRNENIWLFIYLFLTTSMTDTFAHLGGSLIGKHKLAPKISPNKTWEGSIIGGIFGTLIASTFYYIMVDSSVNVLGLLVITLFLSSLGQLGDLFFSSIKRYFDKKDYSNLIPGHGGILDRFDSVIYVSLGLSLILSII